MLAAGQSMKALFRQLWRADEDGFAALVVSALKAHVMGPAWRVTMRTLDYSGSLDPLLAASHALLGPWGLLLWKWCHLTRFLSSLEPAHEAGPNVRRGLGRMSTCSD